MNLNSTRVAELSKRLKPFSEDIQAVAAVALLLTYHDGDLGILAVKRIENPQDPWSGQMALPGGRRELKDRNLKETVIRETLEETGVNLLNHARFLGVLEPVRSAVRPSMNILPFIFLLDYKPEINLNRAELEHHVWVTPKQLLANRGSAKFSYGVLPVYRIGDDVIWGMTYLILTRFLKLLE